ncbi:hypothetical protein [Lunatimonas salinarum]|uniref:hypothetical protein n=1 Tax=Lunatimonas salinarum TaxID=1774590 RepID=UPI001AE0C726|nr:hypothetical protein [Lunatimonas salinarum]
MPDFGAPEKAENLTFWSDSTNFVQVRCDVYTATNTGLSGLTANGLENSQFFALFPKAVSPDGFRSQPKARKVIIRFLEIAPQRSSIRAVADFKAITCPPPQKFIECTDLDFTTAPAIALIQCCAVVLFLFLSVSVGKDILFCNFWLRLGLVRIANVYGF